MKKTIVIYYFCFYFSTNPLGSSIFSHSQTFFIMVNIFGESTRSDLRLHRAQGCADEAGKRGRDGENCGY